MIFHCRLETRPLFHVLTQMIPVNNLTLCIFKILSNIIVPSKPRFIQWFFPSWSKLSKNYFPSHTCCFTRPHNNSWFRHFNNLWWGGKCMDIHEQVGCRLEKFIQFIESLNCKYLIFLLLLPFQACWFSGSNVISFIIKVYLRQYFTLLSLWSWGLDCTSVYLKFLRFTNFFLFYLVRHSMFCVSLAIVNIECLYPKLCLCFSISFLLS
jgi:hypothetical protein